MSRKNSSLPVFDARRLAAVAAFRSKEETRYHLGGVHFEPAPQGGAFAVATDGHTLGCAHDPEGRAGAGGVFDFEPSFLARCGQRGGRVTVKSFGSGLACSYLAHLQGETRGRAFDHFGWCDQLAEAEKFPNWRAVLPKLPPKEAPPPVVNADYLRRFAFRASAEEAGRLVSPRILIEAASAEGGPAVVTRPGAPWFFGLVMPMREDRRSLAQMWIDETLGTGEAARAAAQAKKEAKAEAAREGVRKAARASA